MRSAKVYFKGKEAGTLTQKDDGSFLFSYDETYLYDANKPAISLTFPKSKMEFQSTHLFPFFFNMIPEGVNKFLLCKKKRIDSEDYFGLLLEVAHGDTIGAVQVIKQEIGDKRN